ncbi:MAG TPA: hypothetical protein VJO33_14155 [Gemmatimonadaceae bacterium]|nr:hypothetical protein [Gemmatimonadaceae bacterium]
MAKPMAQAALREAKLAKVTAKSAPTERNAAMCYTNEAILAVRLISWQAKAAFPNANVTSDDANVASHDTNAA